MMLKLVNVSKYYYSKGVVTSGFSKVSLELDRGEFVVITGESGSGKSTLLNVISGLDSYEDGEMYIYGQETSGYTEQDFEDYRKKYISNIFQSFNLVNSYTVYQNVELALQLNGRKRSEYRPKIMDILRKVGLYEFRHARASRLSGGQKQRVAIARALVRDTPVIVCDEPTGNLDSESAENVWELLSRVAEDRLVVAVTHNYEQAEPYATRKITMHDGRISEDLKLRERTAEEEVLSGSTDLPLNHLHTLPKIRLGIRNTFNIVPKFLLLLFIFFFISSAVAVFYAYNLKTGFENDTSGYNYFFDDISPERIVIQKQDRSEITQDDFENLENVPGIGRIFKEDVLVDGRLYIFQGDIVLSGYVKDAASYEGDIEYGRLPENDGELFVVLPRDSFYSDSEGVEKLAGGSYTVSLPYGDLTYGNEAFRICGVGLSDSEDWDAEFYVSGGLLRRISTGISSGFCRSVVTAGNTVLGEDEYSSGVRIIPAQWVPGGKAVVPEEWNYYYKNNRAKGKTFSVSISNLYYEADMSFTVSDVYTYRNFTRKTGLEEWYRGCILINSEDFNSFYDRGFYQSSVFLEDYSYKDEVMHTLEEMGYKPFHVNSHLKKFDYMWERVERLLTTGMSAALLIVLILISYFIIRLIMRSRNTYFSTVRILGGTMGECRSLIVIELLTVLCLSYACFIGAIWAAGKGYYSTVLTDAALRFLAVRDYAVLFGILLVICVWIALRYSRQLFKNSAINTLKGA